MDKQDLIGRVVISKAGRDAERKFIIIGVLDDLYVQISDGSLRKLENPKKKKIKHLIFTNVIAEDIKEKLLAKEQITNSKIKKFLQSVDV
ncbi:RNA-binding protein [Haloimpatiens sp. FM7330]|uniref:RNA-binding protein n=1 Tax=Haloimpatiens sp. FM7330 TaxID=3298610 RepID=UPI003641524A